MRKNTGIWSPPKKKTKQNTIGQPSASSPFLCLGNTTAPLTISEARRDPRTRRRRSASCAGWAGHGALRPGVSEAELSAKRPGPYRSPHLASRHSRHSGNGATVILPPAFQPPRPLRLSQPLCTSPRPAPSPGPGAAACQRHTSHTHHGGKEELPAGSGNERAGGGSTSGVASWRQRRC